MALKAPSNTAGDLEDALSLPSGPGQSPGGAPKDPKILHFIVAENGLKVHTFPVCCSTKTQDKVIKIATQCL